MELDPSQRGPVEEFLGFRLLQRGDGTAEVALHPRAEFLQGFAVVQGGLISALADTACVWALLPDLLPARGMTSVEFKVNFLAPAKHPGDELVARAHVVRRGARVAVCSADVRQGAQHVATGLFTYLIFDIAGEKGPA